MKKPSLVPSFHEQAYRTWLKHQEWLDEMELVGSYDRRFLETCLNNLRRIARLVPESSTIFMEKHMTELRHLAQQRVSFKEIRAYIHALEALHGRKSGRD